MKHSKTSALTTLSIAAALALSACGGGGGGGDSSGAATPASGASQPATTTNLTTPQYPAASAQLAAFTLLNQQRQQCGFPALQDNSTLDQAADAHASYMGQNGGTITDTEVSGQPGFTGVTYGDRAVHFGYPQSVYAGGVSAGYYTNSTLTDEQYGQNLVYAWMSGVYHIAVAAWPVTAVGVGVNKTTFNGFPEIQGTLSIADLKPMTTSGPLTFPCQGTSGLAYAGGGESPTPPNSAGTIGAPVAVTGNPTDSVVLQSGTMTDTSSNVIALQLLNSATDPNRLIPAYEAVAYSATPLQPNMTYSVSLTGTYNGTPFSRSFTFTTGNFVG